MGIGIRGHGVVNMNLYLIVGIILLAITVGIVVLYSDKIFKWCKQNKRKAIAITLGSSTAAAGLAGVPLNEFDIEEFLIDELSDYTYLGYDLSKIKDPIIYQSEVLTEGHLPLAFTFEKLEKSITATRPISADMIEITGFNDINFDYKILVREDYSYQKPVYQERTRLNGSTYYEQTGEETINDYRYVWDDLESVTITEGDTVIIDIIGRFKADVGTKSVDIVPTLTIPGYQKRYDEYAWWNSNWQYRKLITWNTSMISGSPTNFPCLLHLESDSDLAAHATADGGDIAFVDYTDNTTQFNHEIDVFDNATGELIAWVNDTDMSTEEVYMYYGNDVCGDQWDITNTWHSDFRAVYHLTGSHYSNLYDSTSNWNNITSANGDPTYNTDTPIGYGVYMDGTNDFIWAADDDSLSFDTGISGSVDTPWTFMVYGEMSSDGYMIAKYGSSYEYTYRILATKLDCYIYGNPGVSRKANTDVTARNGYELYTMSYDGVGGNDANDGLFFWINNTMDSPFADTGTTYNAQANTDEVLKIGARAAGNNDIEGTFDEVFMMQRNQTSGWKTTFNNTINHDYDGGFFTLGSEEENLTGNYTYTGLDDDNRIPFRCLAGAATWATDNCTMTIYTNVSTSGLNCTHIFLDFCDVDADIVQENFSIVVKNSTDGVWSGANKYQVPATNGNCTINSTIWDASAWCIGTNPFPIDGNNVSILVRFYFDSPDGKAHGTYVKDGMYVKWRLINSLL